MDASATTPTSHPIVVFSSRLRAVLDSLADVPAWSLAVDEQRDVLVKLTRQRARLDELLLRVLAVADRDDVAASTAATSTGAWLAHATTRPVADAHADVRLATALDDGFDATRCALAAGRVDQEQARAVVRSVQAIPADAVAEDPTRPARAETMLLELAADHDARTLQRLGRHLLHALDPDAADERLGRQLDAEERAAARRTSLVVNDNGDGTHSGRFRISDLHAAMLTKALDAIMSPRRADAAVSRRDPRPERRGHAFCELLERMPADRLPECGGSSATVVVTIDLDRLLTGLGTARLDTGEALSAGAARRLACDAGVIPAVVRRLVDGSSVVLDMGRKRRLHTEHMRIALALQQGGCTAEGCTRPPGWCQAHHDVPWSRGGRTSVANGRLLCAFHHGKAHSSAYLTQRLPDGKVRFTRRT